MSAVNAFRRSQRRGQAMIARRRVNQIRQEAA